MYLAILAKEAKFDRKFYNLKSCCLLLKILTQNAIDQIKNQQTMLKFAMSISKYVLRFTIQPARRRVT